MAIIKNTNPFEMDKNISDVFLKYTLVSPITKDNKMYLLIDEDKVSNMYFLKQIWNSLELLKQCGYIRDYGHMVKAGNKYREGSGSSTYKNLEQYKTKITTKEIPFIIYHNKNREKWDFLHNLITNTDSKVNINIHEVETLKFYLVEFKRDFLFVLKKYIPQYRGYLPLGLKSSDTGIEDFLVFLGHKYPSKLKKFYKDVKFRVEGFDFSHISITTNKLIDKRGKEILKISKTENGILSELKKHNKEGGIPKDSLYKSLNQTQGAFEQALKELRRKIKSEELDENIEIHYNFSSLAYTLKFFNNDGIQVGEKI